MSSQWYDEGMNARRSGLTLEDCPYKKYSYGHGEWVRGYNTVECIV